MNNGKSHILIIEDSPDDFEFYARSLDQSKSVFHFSHFASGEEALERLTKQSTYDLLLLDYNLPGINGLNFLQEAHTKNIDLACPTILLTGHGSEHIAAKCLQLPICDYLSKDTLNKKILFDSVSKAIEQHRNYEKEQSKQAELKRFAHTLAHDLKNPLARIQTYCDLWIANPNKQEKYLQKIGDDAHFLMEFVNTLLAYTELGRKIEHHEKVDLDAIIHKSIENLEVSIQQRQAIIQTSGEFPSVHGAKVPLVQLFQNLISNSIKYSVKKPIILIHSTVEKSHVQIYVKDNGVGIPKESVHTIFEPFTRIPNETNEDGTGLGLALVKLIADQHQGILNVLHPFDGGTQINIRLPIG